MPNPWLLIGALVMWIVCVFSAYEEGGRNQQARDQAAAAKVLEQKLAEAQENWETNYAAALEVEQEKQRNVRVRDRKTTAVATALASDSHASSCVLAPDSLRVLSDAITASNSAPDAPASSSDDGLQPGVAPNGRLPGSAGDSPQQHGLDALSVPPQSLGTSAVGR